jgi:pimeloyl-ACP methyl ester carboxylesterase
LRIFVLHKRFVEERTWGRFVGCSETFIESDHPRRWISDYTEFIEARLAQGQPKRVVLVGISEGGEVVPLLAHRISGVTHLVLLASGGMDPFEAYRLQAAKNGRDESIADMMSAEGMHAVDSGDRGNRTGGRARRYWTELSELEPTRNLLALEIPVLVGMGEEDRSLPIEGALLLRDRFAAQGKGNLTVLTFKGADHSLFDSATRESHLPDFWHRLDLWLLQ